MAIRIYAAESIVWRTAGLIAPDESLKGIEEFAVECSIVKVFASEMLDYVADEGVQIFGGYGYHQDYAVERAYLDSRINRIFEGTNEINRLLITGMLLKRAARGQLALVSAAQKVLGEILSGPSLQDDVAEGFGWSGVRGRLRCLQWASPINGTRWISRSSRRSSWESPTS